MKVDRREACFVIKLGALFGEMKRDETSIVGFSSHFSKGPEMLDTQPLAASIHHLYFD
jgi:hypothetical protein